MTEINKNNLPVLYTIPRWQMRIKIPGKARRMYYVPEINEYVDTTHVVYKLPKIGKTPQEWYDRWMLNITVHSDRPRLSNGKIARFRDLCFGYSTTQEEDKPDLQFGNWLKMWNDKRSKASFNSTKGQLDRFKKSEERKNLSKSMTESHKRPEIKSKISENTKLALSTPQVKSNLRNGQLNRYSNPDKKKDWYDITSEKVWNNQSWRKSNSKGQIRRYSNSLERLKTGKSVKLAWDNKLGNISQMIEGNLSYNPNLLVPDRVKRHHRRRGKDEWIYSKWEFKMVHLDSSYESKFFRSCMNLIDDVISLFRNTCHSIVYFSTEKGRNALYRPDFLLNDRYLIEIKPNYLIDCQDVQDKMKAAIDYCNKNSLEYVIITEDYLFHNGSPYYGSLPFKLNDHATTND